MNNKDFGHYLARAEQTVETLHLLNRDEEILSLVQFVDVQDIYTCNNLDIMETRRKFRDFFQEVETLQRYYMSGKDLALNYRYGPYSVIIYADEVDDWVTKLGNGKCRVETVAINSQRIVCDSEAPNE